MAYEEIDMENVQIASMISDTRTEAGWTYRDVSGIKQSVTIVEFPTVDDMLELGMKNIAAQKKFGVEYTSIMSYDIVTQIVRVHLPVER